MSENVSVGKDDYRVQRARLERLVKELAPGCEVHFNPDSVPSYMRMRVDDPRTGAILLVSSGDWHISEIADKSDEELKNLLRTWSGGKL